MAAILLSLSKFRKTTKNPCKKAVPEREGGTPKVAEGSEPKSFNQLKFRKSAKIREEKASPERRGGMPKA